MNATLSYLLSAAPFFLAIFVALAGATLVVTGATKPWWGVAAYLALLFYFPNASWGIVDQIDNSSFYNRGTGIFFFSAINIFLFGLVVQTFVGRTWTNTPPITHNLKIPALLFGLILLGNILIGSMYDQVHWYDIVAYSGLMNVANFMFAFYVFISCVKEAEDLKKLINVLLFCAVTRGIWGLVRFVALGGDPANFYSNFQHIDVKLTFFDINDTLIAMLALFIIAWRLSIDQISKTPIRIAYYAIVGLELFIIVFSYRRTAWGGLALAALLFSFCQKKSVRYRLIAVYLLGGLPLLVYKMLQRSVQSVHQGSLIERLFPDVASGGGLNFTTGRFSELFAAFLTWKESPWLGLGAWGKYSGFRFSELAWHHGNFGWMHSAVMHLALKTGLAGVVISFAAFVGLFDFVFKMKKDVAPTDFCLLMVGLAGVLFMLPNWFVGTAIIEFRTMQLMAFTFALPYMAYAVAKKNRAFHDVNA